MLSLAPMTFLGSGRVIRRVSGSMGPTLTTVATALSSRSSKSTRLTSPSMKAANPHCAWFSDSAKDRPKNIMNDIMCVCWHFRFSTPPYIYHTQQLAIKNKYVIQGSAQRKWRGVRETATIKRRQVFISQWWQYKSIEDQEQEEANGQLRRSHGWRRQVSSRVQGLRVTAKEVSSPCMKTLNLLVMCFTVNGDMVFPRYPWASETVDSNTTGVRAAEVDYLGQLQQKLSSGITDDELLVQCASQLKRSDARADLSRFWTTLDSAAGKGSANYQSDINFPRCIPLSFEFIPQDLPKRSPLIYHL